MGRPKALIEIDGVAMADHVAATLRDVGCSKVVALGGDPEEFATLSMPVVVDATPATGPLGGVLGAVENATGWVFVVACDLPGLTAAALRPMIAAARSHPDADVVVARTGRIEPACALWNTAAATRLRALHEAGERALYAVIGQLSSVEVPVEAASLANINTPHDLDRYP